MTTFVVINAENPSRSIRKFKPEPVSNATKEMVSGFTEQFIIATVESLGLGGVFICGIRNDPEKVCTLLKIPDHVYPVFGLCLGYPDEKPEQKPRLPVNVVLKEDYC